MSDALSVLKDNYNVSHETLSELSSFHDLLFKWQKRHIGSGAGLPGIVLSILTNHKIHLVESDQKKCAFLRTAISRINLNASVYETRLEDMPTLKADIITARAFAPLPRLLALTQKQHHPKLRFLLLKGRDVSSELINIDSWQKIRVVNQHTSITSEDGCILELQCNDAL